jgi:uncharacterized Ntn-hydrolase superfamily protein
LTPGPTNNQAPQNRAHTFNKLKPVQHHISADERRSLILADANHARGPLNIIDVDYYGWRGHVFKPFFAAQRKFLADPVVVAQLSKAYRGASGIPEPEMAALAAGHSAEGDKQEGQGDALLPARKHTGLATAKDRCIDSRLQGHKVRIRKLQRFLSMHEQSGDQTRSNKPS